MAVCKEGPLKIHLIHGARNHFINLSLPADEEGDVLAVRHLAALAHDLTGIPPERQKLIFKGKSLTQSGNPNQSLSSLGLRHGSKVMVLGSKMTGENSDPQARSTSPPQLELQREGEAHTDIGQLSQVEQSLNSEEMHLSTLLHQAQQLTEQMPGDVQQLEHVRKGLLRSTESLMRLLESLDTLRFDPSENDGRTKRKTLVNQIQRHMDQCEEMLTHIKQRLAGKK